MTEYALVAEHIHHRWPSTGKTAINNISLNLKKGEVHAIVGENGAGKTTLGKVLCGLIPPDSGRILVDGKIHLLSQRRGQYLPKTAMVRQRNIWPSNMNVIEAAFLGYRPSGRYHQWSRKTFQETATKWELATIPPKTLVSQCDSATLQRAELISALAQNPDVLILDEPSLAWEEGQKKQFFTLIKKLAEAQKAILLITHRLDDVFLCAQRISVLRHGEHQGSWETHATSPQHITSMMFATQTSSAHPIPLEVQAIEQWQQSSESTKNSQTIIFEAKDLGHRSADLWALRHVSFTLHQGEVLALAGLREEGMNILEDGVTGICPLDEGACFFEGKKLRSIREFRHSGLRYIPSDQGGRGASFQSTLMENLLILNQKNVAPHGWIDSSRHHQITAEHTTDSRIEGHPRQLLSQLSGGNVQKVILSRELAGNPRMVVAADPTTGLDHSSRISVHRQIRKLACQGSAVLLLATDLDEALALSDRMGILKGGQLTEIHSHWTREEAAQCMTRTRYEKSLK